MPLTEEEQRKMYDMVKKSDWTLGAIKERLEKGDEQLGDHEDRLVSLETDQKLLTGKMGLIVMGLGVCFTALLHAVGWIISFFGGKS